MHFLEKYFSLADNSDKKEGKEDQLENFADWFRTARPSAILSKLNEQSDLSSAKNALQQTIDEIDKMIQHPGFQNVSEEYPFETSRLIWFKSYIEAQDLLSENPTNEDVLAWLGQRGWLNHPHHFFQAIQKPGGAMVFIISLQFTSPRGQSNYLRRGDGENRLLLSPLKERALEKR